MEVTTMSAAELAESFSSTNQNQNQTTETKVEKPIFQAQPITFGNKSSEELAAEIAENGLPNNEEGKTEEEIKAEEEAKKIKEELEKKSSAKPKTKIDESFKQGLDLLFKEQKLNPYSDGTETGYVLPDTFEEVLELIEDNKKSWIEESKTKDKQELFNELLSTKSPAWQFVLENSNKYNDPSELLPLLTSVQNIEYSNSLDISNEEDQVKIIRATLSIQGLSASDIESEIEDLKERGKTENRATALKPILDKYNETKIEKILQEKEQEEIKKQTFWNGYYQNLENSVFKAKELDGIKLKNEHKQLIASALIPDDNIGGLPIYTLIDNLVANGNFKVLSKIALLGTDEKLFDSYFLTKKADKAAEGVQRILRQTGTNSNSTEFETETQKIKPIKKSYGYFG